MTPARTTKQKVFPETAAGGFSRVDGTVQFYQRVNALLPADAVYLDIGAGRGVAHVDDAGSYRSRLANMRGKARRVIGIDVDPVVLGNPALDEAHLIAADGSFPVESASVDVAVADHVLEHIEHTARFAAEVARVVKPGGWFCARTPNRWGYISVASRMIPSRLHSRVLRRAQPDRKSEDVFPTFYRMNTAAAIRSVLPDSEWEHHIYAWDAEPAYFGTNVALWQIARGLFSVTPAAFKATLLVFSRRKNG